MENREYRYVSICSDDYGLNQGIDDAVVSLLENNRLTSVSCMTTLPNWLTKSAPRLKPYLNNAEFGVHLNLTENNDGYNQAALYKILLKSYFSIWDEQYLTNIIHNQLDAFELGLRKTPDFIDGHEHVHQFPVIRKVLLQIIKERYKNIWIRNTLPAGRMFQAKPWILSLLGGWSLKKDLQRNAINTNNGFLGVYGFDNNHYANYFSTWLDIAKNGSLIMCHPSTNNVSLKDPISQARQNEYEFFNSKVFLDMLVKKKIYLLQQKEFYNKSI